MFVLFQKPQSQEIKTEHIPTDYPGSIEKTVKRGKETLVL